MLLILLRIEFDVITYIVDIHVVYVM